MYLYTTVQVSSIVFVYYDSSVLSGIMFILYVR
jgi:hypothetical protein